MEPQPHKYQRFRYCPLCATALEERMVMGEKRPVCPNCGWVHYEDPKVAAGVLILRGKEVLLVQRTLDPYQGAWSIPAGFVNAFEDPAAAALRECREETGLNAELDGLFDLLTGREHSRGSDIFIIYRAHILNGTLRAADDADQAAWFPLDHLPPLAFESTSRLLAKALSVSC
ncbi:MAG: NUDIX hydrolase [Anaerolineaceae bacterium]|nr:NUDIX hydrolase [Anaerolineaceae bacterium]